MTDKLDDRLRGREPPPELNWHAILARIKRGGELMEQGHRIYLDALSMLENCNDDPQFERMRAVAASFREVRLTSPVRGFYRDSHGPTTWECDVRDLVNAMPLAKDYVWEEEEC